MRLKVEKSNGYGLGVLTGVLAAVLIFCGAWTGKSLYENRRVKETSVSEDGAESVVNSETLSKMAAIEETINRNFYLKDMTEEELQTGIYNGMVEALDDKYAAYYTAEELMAQLEKNEGVYYGIGAYVMMDAETQTPYISGVIEGTPAEEAGLRMGDIIYAVEGTATFQMALEEVTGLIKGEEGTAVTLTIVRDGKAFEQDVVRRKVNNPTVSSRMLDEEIGYIGITEFKDITVDQFTEAYAVIRGSGAKALVLDLRGNPGGLLDAVVSIGQQILPEGLIVYTEDKSGERVEYTCDGKREIQMPMVVLVNGGSASAAEVLTGAIKDYGVGTVMGTTTYGKGIVQKIIALSDGSAVKLTTSGYFTPKGNNIHGKGIEPDVVVEFDAEAYYGDEQIDNQLEAAQEYLKKKLHG
ncbi:S41 family peptidase [bacterium 1XD8-76]|nr:S41 family peptidase [bacterium 1XD8-76]